MNANKEEPKRKLRNKRKARREQQRTLKTMGSGRDSIGHSTRGRNGPQIAGLPFNQGHEKSQPSLPPRSQLAVDGLGCGAFTFTLKIKLFP